MKRPYVPPFLHRLGGRLRRPEVELAEEPRRLSCLFPALPLSSYALNSRLMRR